MSKFSSSASIDNSPFQTYFVPPNVHFFLSVPRSADLGGFQTQSMMDPPVRVLFVFGGKMQHGKIYDNITELIGNTPMVRLRKVTSGGAEVVVKLEAFNPLSSVKDRIAISMIDD